MLDIEKLGRPEFPAFKKGVRLAGWLSILRHRHIVHGLDAELHLPRREHPPFPGTRSGIRDRSGTCTGHRPCQHLCSRFYADYTRITRPAHT